MHSLLAATVSLSPVMDDNYSLIPGNLKYSLTKHTHTHTHRENDAFSKLRAHFPFMTMQKTSELYMPN